MLCSDIKPSAEQQQGQLPSAESRVGMLGRELGKNRGEKGAQERTKNRTCQMRQWRRGVWGVNGRAASRSRCRRDEEEGGGISQRKN